MTLPIDQLLARARLVNEPYTPEEISAAADRLAARVAARRVEPHTGEGPGLAPEGPQDVAARDLRTLCETAVMSSGALAGLQHFVARSLPEPPGARVLGCILQLTEHEDSARFWWQYAAGAGDGAATYCLYLHHMAHGEEPEAEWWHTQAAGAADDHGPSSAELQDFAATLHVLQGLKETDEPALGLAARAAQVSAVLNYVPAAVSYVDDDLDLPLPDADFTDRITSLTTPPATEARPQPPRPSAFLPEPRTHPIASLCAAATRTAGVTRQTSTTPAAPPRWSWNDSGGAFGYKQRVGAGDLAANARHQHAMQVFWQHCERCADCDPAGIPCPAHTALCPGPL
ncbi:hypothetical protein [Streptomyces sp. DSM 40750]|uniref:hypothetical protein n=1 Tax=Streptomyces sp. DSM 40750 TaxID=2801030 RepID=UPI00214CF055|nr:hypothetical protein [Streptomyces sp. DSM 40750]UUU19333.1 hypothetical protein JIX55_02875 [Streptomyces sp. DSM 40750]UUU27323.1 hypothetical protein JIX55_47875 [Streptomyces sp. DSM 40750]